MHVDCYKFTTFWLKLAVIRSWKSSPFRSLKIEQFKVKLRVRKIPYFKCISDACSKLIFFNIIPRWLWECLENTLWKRGVVLSVRPYRWVFNWSNLVQLSFLTNEIFSKYHIQHYVTNMCSKRHTCLSSATAIFFQML